jgi:hypothetical protein
MSDDPRAAGEALFRAEPELMMVEVAWAAAQAFKEREDCYAFIEAYVNACKICWRLP